MYRIRQWETDNLLRPTIMRRHTKVMQQTQSYRERSRAFLVKARQEFNQGDLVQASEKGWGAAAMMVKAIAAQRGLEHENHRHLFPVVRGLVRQTGDRELRRLFAVANDLHRNFYENWLPVEDVAEGLDDVGEFVEKVERLL